MSVPDTDTQGVWNLRDRTGMDGVQVGNQGTPVLSDKINKFSPFRMWTR